MRTLKPTAMALMIGICLTPSLAAAQPAAQKAATLLARFNQEPTINQVQQAALDYANLHPEIFDAMRTRSRVRGALPELKITLTKDDDEESRSVARFDDTGNRGETTGYDTLGKGFQVRGELKWKLGDMVFNNYETAVSRENRYSARARQQLLQTVNQIYFERRRAQIELLTAPPKDPTARALAELKIQQLTGEIDAITGGRFSRMVTGEALPEQ